MFFYAESQTFHNSARLDTVGKAGFYAVSITPTLSSYVKKDFSDLRVVDENGNPVPYLLYSKVRMLKPDYFKPFKIISNKLIDSGKSVIVLENGDTGKVSEISMRIKNTAVSRTFDISGSDDKTHWFSIVENINMSKRFATENDSYIEDISFPLSAYRYFRIIIYNGKNDPLNIIGAGRYVSAGHLPASELLLNPTPKYKRKDSSDRISYITVFNPDLFHIDHVGLKVKGPKFFRRQVDVVTNNQLIGSFIVSVDSSFIFSLPVINDSAFELRIYNGDNPPLDIAAISTSQENEKIIAYLEAGKNYQLELTNSKATMPRYDLEDFKDSVPMEIPALKFLSIEPVKAVAEVKDKSIFTQVWIWPVLVTVLLVLVLFTFRLTKEVGKKS